MEGGHLLACLLLLAAPVWGFAKDKQLLKKQNKKRSAYWQLMLILLGMSIAATVIIGWESTFIYHQQFPEQGWFRLASTFIIIILILINTIPFLLIKHPQFQTSLVQSFSARKHVYPNTKKETNLFIYTVICIGICEEILYRSFLHNYLAQHWLTQLPLTCIVIANVLFAVTHYHQGTAGIINAFFCGISFSTLFLLSGNLLLPISLHILYDLKIIWFSKALKSFPIN